MAALLRPLIALCALSVLFTGCRCGPGPDGELPDGGGAGASDGGDGGSRRDGGRVDSGYLDGGRVWIEFDFPGNTAHEPCSDETLARARDGGMPEAEVYLPLCIAVRRLSGNAKLNGQPITDSIEWALKSSGYGSDYVGAPDGGGDYQFDVLRSSYQQMEWHPSSIFPTHSGPIKLPAISLLSPQTRDVSARSWKLSGRLTFGGLPWLSSQNPEDTQLAAFSSTQQQSARAVNQNGNYLVKLLEGSAALGVSVPREALGTTELTGLTVGGALALYSDLTLDHDIPVASLGGTLTIDGQPIPARSPNGPDWYLEYEQGAPVVYTYHEGDDATVRALVPRGGYTVNLGFTDVPDRQLPSYLYHKQLFSYLDLSSDQTINRNLVTRHWEGALLVDGQPVPSSGGGIWTLYAYAYDQGASEPWFLAYYGVPIDTPSFNLRMFPAVYYLAVWVDERFHPDLMAGWHTFHRQKDITQDISAVIDIETGELSGILTIDGQPASSGLSVGNLTLTGANGTYRRKLETTDGSFLVRVPRGIYDVSFTIDDNAYPEYAVGRVTLATGVDINTRTTVKLDYKTVRVSGPLAVANQQVPNTSLATAELGLVLYPAGSGNGFFAKLEGGRSWYSFRIPEGDWDLDVRIEEQALPETAWGSAPYADRYPIRPRR